jgi:hypothetical protein
MEEFHAKIDEIFDCIEATPNNLENIEISEGVNICVKIVASQLNTGISSDCPFIECWS